MRFCLSLKLTNSLGYYKARYNYQEGIDYIETISLIIKPTILHAISIAISHGRPLCQSDIRSTFFLHGHLHEKVFMVQSPTFVD